MKKITFIHSAAVLFIIAFLVTYSLLPNACTYLNSSKIKQSFDFFNDDYQYVCNYMIEKCPVNSLVRYTNGDYYLEYNRTKTKITDDTLISKLHNCTSALCEPVMKTVEVKQVNNTRYVSFVLAKEIYHDNYVELIILNTEDDLKNRSEEALKIFGNDREVLSNNWYFYILGVS